MGDLISALRDAGEEFVVSNDHPLPATLNPLTTGLTKTPVTMTGVSAPLLAADAARKVVIVSSTASNAAAAIDPTGGTAALDSGVPVNPGATVRITGKAAQAAMTQIGTNGQKLTVYTGT